MAGFGNTPLPKSRRKPSTRRNDEPRCIVVFGLPLSGTTSSIACLRDATETPTALVLGVDEAEIRQHIRDGAKVVFVDDFDPTVEAVQQLNDWRLVSPAGGALIRMWSSDEDIMARAGVKGRDDVTPEYLKELRMNLIDVEDRIRELSVPYFTIPNGLDFASTVGHLARIAGITK